VIVGDFLVFCWRFFGVLLVFFGNVVDGRFSGDFLDRISWGSFVVILSALKKFPAREKKIATCVSSMWLKVFYLFIYLFIFQK
jgi:hypothetical protein